MLLQFLIVSIEISKLIWENVGIWYKVKVLFAKAFLHSDHIVAKTILTSDLVTGRVVIDLLILVKTLV